jgi:hypothetical protein
MGVTRRRLRARGRTTFFLLDSARRYIAMPQSVRRNRRWSCILCSSRPDDHFRKPSPQDNPPVPSKASCTADRRCKDWLRNRSSACNRSRLVCPSLRRRPHFLRRRHFLRRLQKQLRSTTSSSTRHQERSKPTLLRRSQLPCSCISPRVLRIRRGDTLAQRNRPEDFEKNKCLCVTDRPARAKRPRLSVAR